MNEKLRKLAAATGLCLLLAAGLVSIAADAHAIPGQEVEDTFYNSTWTTVVGYRILYCRGGVSSWGTATPYRIRWVESCS